MLGACVGSYMWGGREGEVGREGGMAFGVIVAGGLKDMIDVRDELGGFFSLRVGWWREGGRGEGG